MNDPTPEPAARDSVDAILDQWRKERPDLPVAPVGVITRLARVRAHLDGALAEVFDGFDLTPADFQVLVVLRRSGAPYRLGQARLMAALGLTSGTVSVRMSRLEARGVVLREADPDDKRTFTVRLTALGEELFDRIAPVHLHGEDLLLSALHPDEQLHLADLLRKLLGSYERTGPQAVRIWGMRVEPAHLARARRAAVGLSDRSGLLVADVTPAGPAALAGIAAGDLVVATPHGAVRSPQDLPLQSGEPVELTLLRGEERIRTLVTPSAAASAEAEARS